MSKNDWGCATCRDQQPDPWDQPKWDHNADPHLTYRPHVHVEAPTCPPASNCAVEGPPGRDGKRGERGPQGETGPRGPSGRDGRDGDVGPQGKEGPEGRQGPRGDKGEQGKEGPKGDIGETGCPGPEGPEGPEGPRGLQGEKGCAGPMGFEGPEGPRGAQGPQGDTGPQGQPGPQGIPGNQGIQGLPGAMGSPGTNGTNGTNGADGLDAVVSCQTNADDDTCYDITFNTPQGEKSLTLQGCVSLLACGYTGDPICVTPTGAPVANQTDGTATIELQHPQDMATLFLQSTPGQDGSVTNITTSVEGEYSCVEWDQLGTFTFNLIVDTTGLPVATKNDLTCYPPVAPMLRLEAPDGTFLNRKVGGSPVNNNWQGGTASDGSTYEEVYNIADYLQDFDEYVKGGVFSADFIGDGRMKVCYRHCYFTPVAAETTVGGDIRTLCDPSGEIPANTPVTLA